MPSIAQFWRKPGVRKVWEETKVISLSVLFVVLTCVIAFGITQKAFDGHWSLAIPVVAFLSYALALGVADLMSSVAQKWPVRKGLSVFTLQVVLSVVVFATVSEILRVGFHVRYSQVGDHHFANLVGMYVWHLLEMVPVLKINEMLLFTAPPIKPESSVAGLPLLAYRAVILLVLFKTLREWWQERSE